MSYTQIGYPAYAPTPQLVGGSPASCCEGSSPEPPGMTGESSRLVCAGGQSCRLTGASSPGYYSSPYPAQTSTYLDSFYPALGPAYGMKEQTEPLRNFTHSSPYYYDPTLAAYGYSDLDLSGPRRKAVTRDSTSTLKAWLNEHRKNPYPTKGEKIMLAIITKMTLTQVSTWFANARRRLKKENKMTWEPRTKAEMEDMEDRVQEEEKSPVPTQSESPSFPSPASHSLGETKSGYHLGHPLQDKDTGKHALGYGVFGPGSPDMADYLGSGGADKPKIWSLADTATSKPVAPPPYQDGLVWYTYHHTDTPPQTPPNLKSTQPFVHNPQLFYHGYPKSSTDLKVSDTYRSPCSGGVEPFT